MYDNSDYIHGDAISDFVSGIFWDEGGEKYKKRLLRRCPDAAGVVS